MISPRFPLSNLWRDRSGVVAIIVALAAPVIFGAAAVAVDIGRLVLLESQLQAAADSAALAAATSLDDTAVAQALAQEYSGKNMPSSEFGTVIQTADVILGNYDTGTSTFTANGAPTNAVQVTAKLTAANGNAVSLYFGKLIGIDTRDVETSALATEGSGGGACILATEASDSGAIQISGTVNLQLNCGIAVNSTDSSQALKVSGNGTINATEVCVAGGAQISGQVSFANASPEEGCTPPSDPLSGLQAPPEAAGACNNTDFKISGSNGTATLSPGVYCNGIEISGSDNTVTFGEGTYVIAGGGLKFSGGGNVIIGSGVLFYNTEQSTQGDFKDIDFSGSSTITFSAPTSGTYAGVLFFQDPSQFSADAGVKFKVAGVVTTNLDGTIYMPDHEVEYSGTASQSQTCPTKIISRTVKFNGTVNTQGGTNCASDNVTIGGSGVRLRG